MKRLFHLLTVVTAVVVVTTTACTATPADGPDGARLDRGGVVHSDIDDTSDQPADGTVRNHFRPRR